MPNKKEFNVYLSINAIKAESIEEAKEKFWAMVVEDKQLLSLEVEEIED